MRLPPVPRARLTPRQLPRLTTRQRAPRPLTPRQVTLLLWAALLAFGLFKLRAYGAHGRFWAEEGRYFFRDLAPLPLGRGLLHLYNDHLELVTNLVVWLATRVDLRVAPLVTTWLSWLLQLGAPALVIHERGRLGLSAPRVLLFVLLTASLASAAEVFANSINLHFHFLLLAGVIAVLPAPAGRRARLYRALLLVAGLSGIPANVLVPVFAWRAWRERSPERRRQTFVLAATAALQLALLGAHGFALDGRAHATSPRLVWLALLAQHLVTPLAGGKLAGPAIWQFDVLHGGPAREWALALALTAGYLALWWWLLRRRRPDATAALAAALLAAVFCVLTSLGDRTVLVSADVGGRYFYAADLLLVLAVLLAVPPVRAPGWRVGILAWAVVCAVPGLKTYLDGPPWPAALAEARAAAAPQVAIWPKGWTMTLPAGQPPLK